MLERLVEWFNGSSFKKKAKTVVCSHDYEYLYLREMTDAYADITGDIGCSAYLALGYEETRGFFKKGVCLRCGDIVDNTEGMEDLMWEWHKKVKTMDVENDRRKIKAKELYEASKGTVD